MSKKKLCYRKLKIYEKSLNKQSLSSNLNWGNIIIKIEKNLMMILKLLLYKANIGLDLYNDCDNLLL